MPAAEVYREQANVDAVIVDEGQDFSPIVWEAVKTLVPARADFIIFYDPQQNIFQRDLSAMPHFPWPDAMLTRNCRNTRAVCEVLRPHAPESMVLHEEAPAGETPEVYSAENVQALRERLMSLLVRLVEKEAIPQHEIVLMGAHAAHKMSLDAINERFPKVRYFTYRKFKGLEAPVLILLDVNEADPLWDRSAHYTAISRAIHKLILLKLTPPTQ
jgi:superfamily I DNA/RNA helicase